MPFTSQVTVVVEEIEELVSVTTAKNCVWVFNGTVINVGVIETVLMVVVPLPLPLPPPQLCKPQMAATINAINAKTRTLADTRAGVRFPSALTVSKSFKRFVKRSSPKG
jgi:hypothetical protein